MKFHPSVQNLRLTLLTILLVLVPWDGGGLRAATLPYYSLIAAVLLLLLLASIIQDLRTRLRPPALLAGLALAGGLFLAYLGLQWFNAGRMLYLDVGTFTWSYSPPRFPHLPFAYNRGDATEILMWFFPAWVIALCLFYQARRNPRPLRIILDLVLLQAGLMALLGILQYILQAPALDWLWSGRRPGFAAFGYANHAAAYFNMMGAIALGLLFRILFGKSAPQRALRGWGAALVALLCLVAACLTISRAGLLLAIGITLFALAYAFLKGWPRMHPALKLNFCVASSILLILATLLVAGLAREPIQRRFQKKTATPDATAKAPATGLTLGVRLALWEVGWDVFLANRWLGNGAWGFKYEFAFHVPEQEWKELVEREGRANVHNDPIQFLSEFGIAGSSLLLAALACLLAPLFAKSTIHGSLFWMTLAGLGAVGTNSIVDLPFRAPAILWTWIAILAMLPGLSAQSRQPVRKPRPCP